MQALLAKHARRAGMSDFALPSSSAPAATGPAAGGALSITSKWRVASQGVADYQVGTAIRLPGYPPQAWPTTRWTSGLGLGTTYFG